MAIKTKLGEIKQIDDLRSVWANEASDFTPWVASNISLLNDATGLSLEVIEQESPVGSFSLDILAKDTESEAIAIIENQLEDTNHDHLGKLLTYASGKSAKYIIWIVKNAREEHRSAIEWLNNNTVAGIEFFLIEMQLWQIGASELAPKFNVVEQPNGWMTAAKQSQTTQGGAAVQFKYEYWSAFNDYAFENKEYASVFRKHKASSDHWYTLNIGSSESHISLLVNTKTNVIALDFFIQDNKSLFDSLCAKKDEIETIIGEKLDWRRLDGKMSSRVLLERKVNLKNKDEWVEQFEWFMKMSVAFKKGFEKYI